MDTNNTIEKLKIKLTDKDPSVRISAIIDLAESDEQDKVRILSHVAHNDPDEGIRARVRKILSRIEPDANQDFSLSDFRNQLLYGSAVEKDSIMRRLLSGEISVETSVIRQFLMKERDVINMASAVKLIGKCGDSRDVEMLVQALSHDDTRVRANAVEALMELGCLNDMSSIRPLLYDPDHRVRSNAILFLFEEDKESLLPIIEEMAESSNIVEMASIAYVLKKIDYPGSKELLSQLEKKIEELSLTDALSEALATL